MRCYKALNFKNMFVEAIVNEEIDRDYLYLSIGDKISGHVRSYKQDFIKKTECIDVIGDSEETFDIIENEIKVKIKMGSIKKVYCGCSELATREVCGEYLCDECEYEEPEDFSYLSQTPYECD